MWPAGGSLLTPVCVCVCPCVTVCVCVCLFLQSRQGAIWGEYYARVSEESLKFPIDQISDSEIKLQLISLQDKGSGALDADKAAHVSYTHLSYTHRHTHVNHTHNTHRHKSWTHTHVSYTHTHTHTYTHTHTHTHPVKAYNQCQS